MFNGNQSEEVEDDGPALPKFSDRWKWFSIVERLADGDVTKFEQVYEVSYLTALNTLSYWKEKQDYQDRMNRRQEMMRQHR